MTPQPAAALSLAILLVAALPTPAADPSPLFPAREGKKFGFIDPAGRMVIPPTFDNCHEPFSHGLAAVAVKDKWGYIDPAGRWVIPPQFDAAQPFRGKIAAARTVGQPNKDDGHWGYVDRTGRFVLGPDAKFAYCDFIDDRVSIRVDDKWGYVDPAGRAVIPPQYKTAHPFSEGLAWVEGDDGVGYIDAQGRWAVRLPPGVTGDYESFREGLSVATDAKTNKSGFVDKTGRWVIPPQFHDARAFHDGRAAVCLLKEEDPGWPVRRWGFVDRTGTIVVPVKYAGVGHFAQGLASVRTKGLEGFVDRDGVEVIKPQFNSTDEFSAAGIARVTVGNSYGDTGYDAYIDKTGRFVWRPSDFAARDAARLAEQNREPSIRAAINPKGPAPRTLVLRYTPQIALTGPDAGKISITIANYSEVDLFLEVTDIGPLDGWIGDADDDGICQSFGAPNFAFRRRPLFRQLHAAQYSPEGKLNWCNGCGAGLDTVRLDLKLADDALTHGRARGRATFPVAGVVRATATDFRESLDLPIELVDPVQVPKPNLLRPAP